MKSKGFKEKYKAKGKQNFDISFNIEEINEQNMDISVDKQPRMVD